RGGHGAGAHVRLAHRGRAARGGPRARRHRRRSRPRDRRRRVARSGVGRRARATWLLSAHPGRPAPARRGGGLRPGRAALADRARAATARRAARRVKTAVVTGASSGLGEATARRLARDGWRVLLVARREERLAALASELGDGVTYEAADLTDPGAAARIAKRVEDDFGGLHLLVNNAGGNPGTRTDFAEGGYPPVREIMDLNFDSAVRLTEALLPLL